MGMNLPHKLDSWSRRGIIFSKIYKGLIRKVQGQTRESMYKRQKVRQRQHIIDKSFNFSKRKHQTWSVSQLSFTKCYRQSIGLSFIWMTSKKHWFSLLELDKQTTNQAVGQIKGCSKMFFKVSFREKHLNQVNSWIKHLDSCFSGG